MAIAGGLGIAAAIACSASPSPRTVEAVPKDMSAPAGREGAAAPVVAARASDDAAAPPAEVGAGTAEGAEVGVASAEGAGEGASAGESAAASGVAPPIDPLAAMVASTPRCPPEVKHCVLIQLHVARGDDGALVQDAVWMSEQILAADQRFAAIDVAFEVAGVSALPPAQAAIVSRSDRDLLGRPHFSRGPIHVFVVGSLADVDEAGAFIRGVHWRDRADRERRWVILSSIAGSLVLTHEVGHFFGLPHSSYLGSVMNKQDAATPLAERGFHPREVAKIRRGRDEMLASGMLAALPSRERARRAKAANPGE